MMEQLTPWELLRMHLAQPEYLHVILNPLPVYGLGCGVLLMGLSLVLRHRRVELAALVLVFMSALSAWPVAHYGEKGYDRILTLADDDGQAWLAAHRETGRKVLPLFHLLAVVSAAAALVPFRWPRARRPLWVGTLFLALAALAAGGWIGYSGGKIRHKEFRYAPPPEVKTRFSRLETWKGEHPVAVSERIFFTHVTHCRYLGYSQRLAAPYHPPV